MSKAKILFDVVHIDKDNNDCLLSELHTTIGGALMSVAKNIDVLNGKNGVINIEAYENNDTEGKVIDKYSITKVF